jgi:hypothetical protein
MKRGECFLTRRSRSIAAQRDIRQKNRAFKQVEEAARLPACGGA